MDLLMLSRRQWLNSPATESHNMHSTLLLSLTFSGPASSPSLRLSLSLFFFSLRLVSVCPSFRLCSVYLSVCVCVCLCVERYDACLMLCHVPSLRLLLRKCMMSVRGVCVLRGHDADVAKACVVAHALAENYDVRRDVWFLPSNMFCVFLVRHALFWRWLSCTC